MLEQYAPVMLMVSQPGGVSGGGDGGGGDGGGGDGGGRDGDGGGGDGGFAQRFMAATMSPEVVVAAPIMSDRVTTIPFSSVFVYAPVQDAATDGHPVPGKVKSLPGKANSLYVSMPVQVVQSELQPSVVSCRRVYAPWHV